MRGKVTRWPFSMSVTGITPAYAGKRLMLCHRPRPRGDHPRVCGEKRRTAKSWIPLQGSPPRMRGKVCCAGLHHLIHGITPAYAGKRDSPGQLAGRCRDHPRVCGEKAFLFEVEVDFLRITPAYAGKSHITPSGDLTLGITPAYAGKSGCCHPDPQSQRDHPRVCGEKTTANPQATDHWGSPPRVRGKVRRGHLQHAAHGITPAYAGKRPLTVCWRWQKRDHPRVCGERAASAREAYFIWDHPRVCGEKTFDRLLEMAEKGSPPRVRGKSGFCQRSILHLGSPPRMRGKDL